MNRSRPIPVRLWWAQQTAAANLMFRHADRLASGWLASETNGMFADSSEEAGDQP